MVRGQVTVRQLQLAHKLQLLSICRKPLVSVKIQLRWVTVIMVNISSLLNKCKIKYERQMVS